jgi:dCMP deaminase
VIETSAPTSKWDDRALELAWTIAGWSSCWRDGVGAVVMSPEHDVIATGFNDTPRGWPNCSAGGCPRAARTTPSGAPQADDEVCLHAEDNALQRAGLAARGATLYVTRQPCAPCARRAHTAGIARVVVRP